MPKSYKILLLTIITGLVWKLFIDFEYNVPFNSQSHDYRSAIRLAASIAKHSDCDNTISFEYVDKDEKSATFSCQIATGVDKYNDFSLLIFYDQAEKNKQAQKFSLTKDWNIFKEGSFYIIAESIQDGHINTAKDFVSFPGNMVIPLSLKN
jgi:hypothetical protein